VPGLQLSDEFLRPKHRQLACELEHTDVLDAQILDQLLLLFAIRQLCNIAVGVQHKVRYRIEGDGHALAAEGPGARHHLPEELLVAQMDPIERADRRYNPWPSVVEHIQSRKASLDLQRPASHAKRAAKCPSKV
jgi:hypothetical protein